MSKNQSLKCSQVVRAIPLERFRLPGDGRKWHQAARSRKAFLLHLSSYANGDGTFTGVENGRNYSPSLKTLVKDFSRASYTRITGALQTLGLLSWTREKHYMRRIYTIHVQNQCSDSTESVLRLDGQPQEQCSHSPEQCSDSTESVLRLDGQPQEQCSHSPEQCSDSTKSVLTSVHHPSLPSEEPSKESEPFLPSCDGKPSRSPSNGKVKSSGQEKRYAEAVEFIIMTAKKANPAAMFSAKSKRDLREALSKLPPGSNNSDLYFAVTDRIAACDDWALKNFGSGLAVELVASVEARREKRADEAAEKSNYDAAVAAHTAKCQREDAEREAAAATAKPDPTAEELFGRA
jgi:hypothetical protein